VPIILPTRVSGLLVLLHLTLIVGHSCLLSELITHCTTEPRFLST
jgi:hypothetical protein